MDGVTTVTDCGVPLEPTTEAGRRLAAGPPDDDDLVAAILAIEAEARASQPLTSRQEVRFIPQACPVCGAFIRVAQPLPSAP